MAGLGDLGLGLEVFTQLAKNELSSLVDLVTETAVSVDDLDIESDVTTYKKLVNTKQENRVKSVTYHLWCRKPTRNAGHRHHTQEYP